MPGGGFKSHSTLDVETAMGAEQGTTVPPCVRAHVTVKFSLAAKGASTPISSKTAVPFAFIGTMPMPIRLGSTPGAAVMDIVHMTPAASTPVMGSPEAILSKNTLGAGKRAWKSVVVDGREMAGGGTCHLTASAAMVTFAEILAAAWPRIEHVSRSVTFAPSDPRRDDTPMRGKDAMPRALSWTGTSDAFDVEAAKAKLASSAME